LAYFLYINKQKKTYILYINERGKVLCIIKIKKKIKDLKKF